MSELRTVRKDVFFIIGNVRVTRLCFNLFVTCPAQYWSWRKHLINGAHIMTVGHIF